MLYAGLGDNCPAPEWYYLEVASRSSYRVPFVMPCLSFPSLQYRPVISFCRQDPELANTSLWTVSSLLEVNLTVVIQSGPTVSQATK